MTDVLIRRQSYEDRFTERMTCDDKGRDRRQVVASLGTLKIT